jgi:uncharacterized membrane protein
MIRIITLLVALASLLFIAIGVRWLVDPAGAAPELGLSLSQGLGLSTQIGDISSFFLTLGLCIAIALVSKQRIWYYPAIMLLVLAALGRLAAWSMHGAALAVPQIAVEVLVALLLWYASKRLGRAS